MIHSNVNAATTLAEIALCDIAAQLGRLNDNLERRIEVTTHVEYCVVPTGTDVRVDSMEDVRAIQDFVRKCITDRVLELPSQKRGGK